MSTSIHLITQIRKDKDSLWVYVPEIPKSIDNSGYGTYSFLAKGIRDYFQSDGFECRGLPKDLNGEKFGWYSYSEPSKVRYDSETRKKVKLPDGSYLDYYDERIRVYVDTEEEAKKHDYYRCSYSDNKFSYQDPSILGGEFINVPVKELMSYEEFLKDVYEDDWDEDHQDYGNYKVDFSCSDFHSHSYLSLQELIDCDKSDYFKEKVKVVGSFWKKFKELGGVLPDGMGVIEEDSRVPADIIDAIRFSYQPDVIVYWDCSDLDKEQSALMKGINELKEIASKYNISDFNDIRIVYCFDN